MTANRLSGIHRPGVDQLIRDTTSADSTVVNQFAVVHDGHLMFVTRPVLVTRADGVLVVHGSVGDAIGQFHLGLGQDQAITVAFLTIALAQLWNVFNVRKPKDGLVLNEITLNVFIWLAIALCLLLIAAAVWIPGLSSVLDLPPPTHAGLAVAAGMSLVPLVFGQALLALDAQTGKEKEQRVRS